MMSTCVMQKMVIASFRTTGPLQQPMQPGSLKYGPSAGHGGVVVGHIPRSWRPLETYVEKSRMSHSPRLSPKRHRKCSTGESVRLRHFHESPATIAGIATIQFAAE